MHHKVRWPPNLPTRSKSHRTEEKTLGLNLFSAVKEPHSQMMSTPRSIVMVTRAARECTSELRSASPSRGGKKAREETTVRFSYRECTHTVCCRFTKLHVRDFHFSASSVHLQLHHLTSLFFVSLLTDRRKASFTLPSSFPSSRHAHCRLKKGLGDATLVLVCTCLLRTSSPDLSPFVLLCSASPTSRKWTPKLGPLETQDMLTNTPERGLERFNHSSTVFVHHNRMNISSTVPLQTSSLIPYPPLFSTFKLPSSHLHR